MPAIGDRSHARSLRRTPPIQQAVFLTVPAGYLRHSEVAFEEMPDGSLVVPASEANGAILLFCET